MHCFYVRISDILYLSVSAVPRDKDHYISDVLHINIFSTCFSKLVQPNTLLFTMPMTSRDYKYGLNRCLGVQFLWYQIHKFRKCSLNLEFAPFTTCVKISYTPTIWINFTFFQVNPQLEPWFFMSSCKVWVTKPGLDIFASKPDVNGNHYKKKPWHERLLSTTPLVSETINIIVVFFTSQYNILCSCCYVISSLKVCL